MKAVRFIVLLSDYLGRAPLLSRVDPLSRVRSVDPDELFESLLLSLESDCTGGAGVGAEFTVDGADVGSGVDVLVPDVVGDVYVDEGIGV